MSARFPTKHEYQEYLKSPHWCTMRRLACEYYGSRCVLCGGTDGLNVHHKHYRTYGCEWLRDLTVLCRNCHEKFHDVLVRSPDAPDDTMPAHEPLVVSHESKLFPRGGA